MTHAGTPVTERADPDFSLAAPGRVQRGDTVAVVMTDYVEPQDA